LKFPPDIHPPIRSVFDMPADMSALAPAAMMRGGFPPTPRSKQIAKEAALILWLGRFRAKLLAQ